MALPLFQNLGQTKDYSTQRNTTYRSSINQLLEQKVVGFDDQEEEVFDEDSVDISEEEKKREKEDDGSELNLLRHAKTFNFNADGEESEGFFSMRRQFTTLPLRQMKSSNSLNSDEKESCRISGYYSSLPSENKKQGS